MKLLHNKLFFTCLVHSDFSSACVLNQNVQIKHFISQCFKNMPLIAAIHHQQWMCYTLSSQQGKTSTNFLYSGDLTCGYTLSQVHNMLLSYVM